MTPDMESGQVFLSTVSNEFGSLRRRLAALLQRTKKVHVRHQDDFFHRGVKTLQLLEEEVERSALVLHVIGAEPGWAPPQEQVEALAKRRPDFAQKYPEIIAEALQEKISATQWEAWLGLYFGKRLCSYQLEGRDGTNPSQAQHLQRLRDAHEHPRVVADEAALYDEMLGSLLTLGFLTERDVARPIQLPFPSIGSLFKGRESFLAQLRESLQRTMDGRATAIVQKAVHGLGGVGKTRLAVEYAWQHADDYSAVLFVTADTPQTFRQNLAALVGPPVLNLPDAAVTEEEARVAAALRWLKQHPGWFLIVDNVDTEEAAEEVERQLAQLYGGQVLITSRLAKWGSSVEPLELEVLETGDAAQFLLERTDPGQNRRGRKLQPDDEAVAGELAVELDGLALALEQASVYICQKRITLTDYANRWRSHDRQVQQWHDRTMQYPRSVAATWQTTLDELSPDEIELLNVLAWFAPDPIPLEVLDQLSSETLRSLRPLRFQSQTNGLEETAAQAESEHGSDELTDIRDLLPNLADYSMIGWDVEMNSINVHRVVQKILRNRQTQPAAVLSVTLNLLDAALPDGNPSDVRTWPAWEPLRPHVAFTTGEAEPLKIAVPTSRLMGQLGTLLWSKALHAEAEPLMRRALAIDEQSYGEEHPNVARDLNNLAQLLQATNRLAEAEPLMRRALAIGEQSYGEEHPNVAIHLTNLAQLLQATNRLAEAEPLMRRALAIGEQSYGKEHPKVAIRLNNLALLLQATNRLAEAEPLMRRALAIDEQSYGEEHPRVAIRLNNLALLLQATNRLVEAEPLMRRALAIFFASLGADHPNTRTVRDIFVRCLSR